MYEVKQLQTERRRAAKAIAKSRLMTERDVADVQREMQASELPGCLVSSVEGLVFSNPWFSVSSTQNVRDYDTQAETSTHAYPIADLERMHHVQPPG